MQRIDSHISVPEAGHFLKGENALHISIKALFAAIYGGLSVRAKNKKGASKGAFFCTIFLNLECVCAMWLTSNTHGHDDVAVAVRFVGERAHLAGGLFILQLNADRTVGRSSKKIEHIG